MMRFGSRYTRFAAIGVTAGVAVLALASASAQQAPQIPVDEDARLALIDNCVLNESARFGQYDNFSDRCKCATNDLMKSMSQKDMQAVAKWRKPTSSLKNGWQAAWDGCQ